jgi:uncharacterized membrane protein YccC
MLRATLFRRYLFSHLLYSGLTVAVGVLSITLGMYALVGLTGGMAASTGALVVSAADVPTPRGDKFRNTLVNLLLSVPVTFIVGLLRHHPWWLAIVIMALSFIGGMLTAWGRKAMPQSISVFLSMAFALAVPAGDFDQLIYHTQLMLLGGALYVPYASIMNGILAARTKQQVMADCLHDFATYLRRKARFFDADIPLDKVQIELLRQQGILADKLQSVRDFVFRRLRSDDDWALAAGMLALLDANEQVLASQSDYNAIRQHFGHDRIMPLIRAWINAGADHIERLSRERMVGMPPGPRMDLSRPEAAVIDELAAMAERIAPAQMRAYALLDALVRKMQGATASLDKLDAAYREPVDRSTFPDVRELNLFATRAHYSLRPLLRELHRDSPAFRYAVRISLAMACGYILARILPYAAHGYWIVLTIAVILRSSFSQTSQRRADRMMGTLVGCVLTAIVVKVVEAPVALIAIVFVCVTISHAFAAVRYRYTATAASMMGLLQLHLLEPGTPFVISERLVDTAIGAALAYAFSFVLPNWESRAVPGLTAGLRNALASYTVQALSWAPRDFSYRIARRRLHDALAAVSQAGIRMQDEPEQRHVAMSALNAVTTASYLLNAHLAAVRVLISTRRQEFDQTRAEALLKAGRDTLLGRLNNEAAPSALPPPAADMTEDSAEAALRDRLEQALHDSATLPDALANLIADAHRVNDEERIRLAQLAAQRRAARKKARNAPAANQGRR